MRHLACTLSALAVLAVALAVLDALAQHSQRGGTVFVLARGEAGGSLNDLLRPPGVRLVDAWAGGRLVQLHAGVLGEVRVPPGVAWIALRLPLESLALPACG